MSEIGSDTRSLAYYVVPGHVSSAAPVAREVRDGAERGFGAVLVSERLNVKHSAVLGGYAAALAGEMEIVTAVTFPHTRHPMDLAAYGATMAQLAGGGFTMGMGRGPNHQWDAWGMLRPSTAMLEDAAGVLRTLWSGGTVADHDGPLGRFPGRLTLGVELACAPRLALGALGPKTQEMAGRAFDDLILHSHWTDEAVADSVARVRKSAEHAGRDPNALRVWAMLVTACDQPEEQVLLRVVRRMTTYMQWPGYGELIVRANGWDPAVLRRVREHPLLVGRMADVTSFSTDELRRLAAVYPESWLLDGAAIGDAQHCAARARQLLDAGAHRVILHGNAPADLDAVLAAFCATT
ncbi:TIGR03857 family LLM class F420-dependent oxidoreductase [[Mycobacterium] zoologicum]|uniref:TIGR03857 family LLM class F420-dependent oxidoreductase n=1 Tax=[Mycobacterium] zoologicum TaxID=2872311 RepID=UPI001CDB2DFE|nr:TIGR03857 family LLM class F420-dependent oxidoreductase [Mycolicibacter sp. MYC101]MEB3061939.1 TIGR03857 family LLM class F420-dependent oxidoreductase [Mycolicibacter sp. MYC101]